MPGLEYKVSVNGAAQGAAEVDKLAQATAKVAGETGKAAPEAKGLAESFAGLASRANPVREGMEGITMATRGGEGAMLGFAKIFKSVKELASGGLAALGPGGMLVVGLGLVISLLPKVIEYFKNMGESAEELAKRTEAAKSAAMALGQARMDNLKEGLNKISELADKAKTQLQQLHAAAERVDDAKTAAAHAQIDSNDKLDDNQKTAAHALVDNAAKKEKDARKIQLLQGTVGIDAEDLSKKTELADKARQPMDQLQ